MSARRSFVELCALLALGACRCDDTAVVVSIADGASIAPHARAETYVPRLVELGAKKLLIPYTDPSTDIAAIRDAVRGTDIELIIGLTASRSGEDEWNTPSAPPSGLADAIDRAKVAGDELDGVHLDHLGSPPEDLDATIAQIRAATDAPISFAIRARTITIEQLQAAGFPPPADTTLADLDSKPAAIAWANAWAAVLADRVDRVVVHTENAARLDVQTLRDDLEVLESALAGRAEVWATVDPLSATLPSRESKRPKTRPARSRDELQSEIDVLRSHARAVLVASAESFTPEKFLAPDQETRSEPLDAHDLNLENRAEEVNARLRRCCLRDGQVVTVYDHRYERDGGDNMWQEDACWLTGLYTAALSFRYAVTRDPDAEAEARAAWTALHQMANTTPMKGEIVRNYSRTLYGAQTVPPPPEGDLRILKYWHRARDRELYWVGDISVDQLSGWFNGVAAYYDLVANDDEKREISADVAAALDMYLDNDLHAIEFTGDRTRFGDLRSEPVLALAFFQIGYHITGDARYRAEYERLLDQEGAHFTIANVLAVYRAAGRFGSDHFYNSGFYPLIMYETDKERRKLLELSFDIFHALKRRDGDAYADMVYGVFHPALDAWRRSARELIAYRPELTANSALLAELSALDEGPFVPVEIRPAAELDFDYVPPKKQEFRGGLEHRFSGVGFLISYWMARYHGLIALAEGS